MIDSNETDYKVIVINVNDPRAALYNNITDVPQVRQQGMMTHKASKEGQLDIM
jgi:inorganic pyrophosphatase